MLKNPVLVEDRRQSAGTARPEGQARRVPVRAYQARNFVMDERKISELFKSYFHNKMTLPLLLIQAKRSKPDARLIESVRDFLDDIFRHMFEGVGQKRYRLRFKWLLRFFERLPDVRDAQRNKAKDFIRAIYEALGLHLKDNL